VTRPEFWNFNLASPRSSINVRHHNLQHNSQTKSACFLYNLQTLNTPHDHGQYIAKMPPATGRLYATNSLGFNIEIKT
jgi:hypothetical protein